MTTKDKILRLWNLEDLWTARTQPEFTAFGNMRFRRIDELEELRQVVAIQDEMKQLKKEIRKELGFVKYILKLTN